MILNAYDIITDKLDKTKSWIDVKSKKLYSREINYAPYYTIAKKYNIEENMYQYYIIMSFIKDKKLKNTKIDDYGRIKLSLSIIWNDTYLKDLKTNENIVISLVERDEKNEVYLLNV